MSNDDGWGVVKTKKSSAKPAQDSTRESVTSTYEAMKQPRFGNNFGGNRGGPRTPVNNGSRPGGFGGGAPGSGAPFGSGGGGFGNNSGGGLMKRERGGTADGGRPGAAGRAGGFGGRPGAQEGTMMMTPQIDYFAQEGLETAEMVPAGETREAAKMDIAYLKTVAALVHKFRSSVAIPEKILQLNLEIGRGGGQRGDRSNRNGGVDSFARGIRSNMEEPGFGDGRGSSAQNNPMSGGDPGASSFARGQKSYTQASTNQNQNQNRGGGRGGRRGEEQDCDPNLVIERVTLADIVEDENSPAAKAPDAASTEEKPAEDDDIAAGFVRRQAKRKLNESDDERVKRQLRGHLNKLTEKSYGSILEKTCGETGIATDDQLQFFIKLVYEKASQMEKFLQLYARLMVDIESKMIEKKVIDDDAKVFKTIVLSVGQEMYHNVVVNEWEPDADLDDDDKFNAEFLRKKERKGLACFIAILTTTSSITNKKGTSGLMARKVNKLLMEDSFNKSDKERNIEFIMSLYGAYMDEMDSCNEELVVKAQKVMNEFIPKIEELCSSGKLAVRHQMLMENLIDDWKCMMSQTF